MKKILFLIPLAMIVLASCSKSTPAEQVISIFNDTEKAISDAKNLDDMATAYVVLAEKAQKFFDENGKDWKPTDEELKGIQEAEQNCMKAMETKQEEIAKNISEDEAMNQFLSFMSKISEVEKKFPDAKLFSFMNASDAEEENLEAIEEIEADSVIGDSL